MHSIHLSLYSLSLALMLIALALAGTVAWIELFNCISPLCATSVKDRVAEGFIRIVQLAAIVYSAIVILHLLIGGGINAL